MKLLLILSLILLLSACTVEEKTQPEVMYVPDPTAVTIAVPVLPEQVVTEVPKVNTDLKNVKLRVLDTYDGRNNLGNIRTSKHNWQGKIACDKPSAFECFEHPVFGVRAVVRILKTYYNKYNLTTVEEMISRYAPPSENNTDKYISFVSSQMDVAATEKLDMTNDKTMYKMVMAMLVMESGWQYDTQDVVRAAIMLERQV